MQDAASNHLVQDQSSPRYKGLLPDVLVRLDSLQTMIARAPMENTVKRGLDVPGSSQSLNSFRSREFGPKIVRKNTGKLFVRN